MVAALGKSRELRLDAVDDLGGVDVVDAAEVAVKRALDELGTGGESQEPAPTASP
jgi:hypothetical protein